MTDRMTRTAKIIFSVVLALAFVFTMAFALLPANLPTAQAETVTIQMNGQYAPDSDGRHIYIQGGVRLNFRQDDYFDGYGEYIGGQPEWGLDVETTDANLGILNITLSDTFYKENLGQITSTHGTCTVIDGTHLKISDIYSKSLYINNPQGYSIPSALEVETGVTYPLTFNVNGGTINAGDLSYYFAELGATLPSDVTREGYTFGGWYATSGLSGDAVTSIPVNTTGAKTYWAKWIPLPNIEGISFAGYNDYYDGEAHGPTVTGDLEGCTVKYSTDGEHYDLDVMPTYTDVVDLTLYYKVTKEGYMPLKGNVQITIKDVYYMVGTFSDGERRNEYLLTLDTDPYAETEEWYLNEVALTVSDSFRIQAASGVWFPADESKVYGENGEIAKTGNYNVRFRPKGDGRGRAWFNKLINVKYIIPTHSVTFETNGGVINSGAFDQYDEEKRYDLPTDVTKDGYLFAGWFDNEEFNGNAISAIFETDIDDKSYWAKWVENVARVGETDYASLVEAYEAAEENGTIKLLCDIDLAQEAYNYIIVRKNVTIDLNGHILRLTSDTEGRYKIWVTDGGHVTIDNSEPAAGGIFGTFGVKSIVGSYVCLLNSRLDRSRDSVIEGKDGIRPAEAVTLEDISGDKYGFLTLIRPMTDEEKIALVEFDVSNIGEVTHTEESKAKIDRARESYDALPTELQAQVTNYDVLQAAEAAYPLRVADKAAADQVKEKINVIGIVVFTEACKDKITAAREAYDALTDEQKALVNNYTLLTDAQTRYNELEDAYAAALDVRMVIDDIGAVEDTEQATADKIAAARTAYDALDEDAQSFVTNYATLSAAEATYEWLQENKVAAGIGDDRYDTVEEAFAAAESGDTIKLFANADLSNKGAAYLMIRKDVTIDLNGHVLDVTSAGQSSVLWVTDGAYLTIDNTRPANGGLKGTFGAYVSSGAAIILKDCRLTLSRAEVTDGAAYRLEKGYIVKDLADGTVNADGFAAIVRLGNDQDAADAVSEKIDALPAAEEITDEDRDAIKAARDAYEALTSTQKAKVEAKTYEKLYAALAVIRDVIDAEAVGNVNALIDALPGTDAITVSDKSAVQKARTAYEALNADQKEMVRTTTVEKLTSAEERIAYLEEVAARQNACKHVGAQIAAPVINKTSSYGAITSNTNYKNNSIASGATGVLINFKGVNNTKCPTGSVKLTVTLGAPEEMTVKIHWYIFAQPYYSRMKVTARLNSGKAETLLNEEDVNQWFVYEAHCLPGRNTLEITLTARGGTTSWNNPEGRDFIVLPESFSSFDEDRVCASCGKVCTHSSVEMAYDSRRDQYYFKCKSLCKERLEVDEILNADHTTLESARYAYKYLSNANKAKVPSELYDALVTAENEYAARVERESVAKVGIVSDTIYLMPAADAISVLYRDDMLAARKGYNALTTAQRGMISEDLLQKLTDIEAVMPGMWDQYCADKVIELLDALPTADNVTLGDKAQIEAARAAYDALSSTQQELISEETPAKLTDAEAKIVELTNKAAAGRVTAAIDALPAADSVTLDDKARIEAARAAYNALSADQKALISEETSAKLTADESRYAQLKDVVDEAAAQTAEQVIDDLPAEEEVVFGDQGRIEQACMVYNALTAAQKLKVTDEMKTKLSAVEFKLDLVRWQDVVLEDGTYLFVSATDETKTIVRVNKDKIQIAAYNAETINDNLTNNRSGKWKIVRQGEDPVYAISNIYDAAYKDNNRLLDVGGWNSSLADGDYLDLVAVTAEKSEYETNTFRFTKRVGVDMAADEYYIRCISAEYKQHDLVFTLQGNEVKMGTLNYRSDAQTWKVIKVNGDEDFAQTVIDLIDTLPSYDDTALTDEEAITEVRTAYGALTAYQKGLVTNLTKLTDAEQKIVDIKAAAATDATITAIGTVADTAESKALIDAARVSYNALTAAQKLLVEGLATLQAAEETCAGYVITAVEALPTPAELAVATHRSAVEAARSKYTALTEEEKAYVTAATLDKLTADEVAISIKSLPAVGVLTLDNKAAVVAARETYTALSEGAKTVLGDVLDLLEAAETEIADIEAAKAVTDAIDALPAKETIAAADDTKIVEARTAYTALSPYQKGKVPAASYDKLVASEAAILVLKLPAYAELTLDHTQAVADAGTAFDALTADQLGKVSDENKSALAAAQKKIADMTAAKSVSDAIDAIGDVEYTPESKAKIADARALYNDLTADQKAFVKNYSVLTDAEAAYAARADEEINGLIDVAVEDISIDEKENILLAKETYDNLTPEEKQLLPKGTVDKLQASVTTVAIIEIPEANEVEEDVTPETANAIKAAKEAYDDLTPEQQALIPDGVANKVFASSVVLEIVELPDGEEIGTDDKQDITAAKAAYDDLTPEQQDLVPQEKKDKLQAAVTTVVILEIPEANAVDEDVTTDDANAIKAAKEAYDDLTPEQQALIPDDVANKVLASSVALEIVELPDGEEIDADSEDQITAAREAYDDLTPEQQAKVPQSTVDTLVASETVLTIVKLPGGEDVTADSEESITAAREAYDDLTPEQQAKVPQATVDTLVATETVLTIVKLPAAADISAESEDVITAARTAYDALTPEQKAKVPQTTVDTLVAAESTLSIAALPNAEEVTLDDKTDIVNAKAAYDALTEAQKEKVAQGAKDKLLASAATIAILEIPAANEIDEDITPENANAIKAAKEAYDDLTPEQQALIPDGTANKVLASATTLAILEIPAANEIDEEITPENANAIKAAKEAYDDLTPEQQALIPDDVVNKVFASSVVLEIVELPSGEEIGTDDKQDILAAKAAYDSLTPEQQALIPDDVVNKVLASSVVLEIVELPDGEEIDADSEESITAARSAYNALTDGQKAKVPQSTVDTLVASETVLTIVKLPGGEDITTESEDSITAAREAYDDLTPEQKAKVPQATVDTLVASETVLTIVKLPAAADITADAGDAITAARTAYDALTNEQKAKVPQTTVDTLVAAESTLSIAALPNAEEITLDDKTDIVNAKAAYDALTAAQREKMTDETVDKLFASVTTLTIAELPSGEEIGTDDKQDITAAKAAYDALTPERQGMVPQEKKDKLYAAVTTVAILEIPEANAVDEEVTTEDANAIKAARAAYNALTNEQKAMIPDDVADKVLASSVALAIVELPSSEDISADSEDSIAAAREAYNALTPEQQAKVPQATVDTLVASETVLTIVKLPAAADITADSSETIAAARTAYDLLTPDQLAKVPQSVADTLFAAETTVSIAKLPSGEDITAGSEGAITAAREAYNMLTPEQQAKVPQATVDTLVASETVLTIVKLPAADEIWAGDKDAIAAAKDAYDALTPEQQAKVPQGVKDTLFAAVVTVSIADMVDETLITADDEEEIAEVRAAYEALTEKQKEAVPQAQVDRLVACETTLTIVKLPAEDAVTAESADTIAAARAAFDRLTDAQKEIVPNATKDKLVASEVVLTIIELPETSDITADSADAIAAAKAAYDALSEKQKMRIPQDALDTLRASDATLSVVELPVVGVLTLEDKADVVAARAQYEALSAEGKAKVPAETLAKLAAAEKEIADIEESDASSETIVALPAIGVLTLDDKADVVAARAQYEALSAEGKAKVSAETLAKLAAAEKEIADIEESDASSETIVALPAIGVLTLDDEEDVVAARAQYEALSAEGKAKVSAALLAKLVEAEEVFASVDKINAIGEVEYTAESKAAIDEARAYYETLTDAQKAAIPADVLKRLTDKEEAYAAMDEIESIGTIEATTDNKEKIQDAREAYDALSEDQKALVDPAFVKTLEDAEAAHDAIDETAAIGDVAYTSDSKALIDDARARYDALSEDQKALVPEEVVAALVKAEEDYAAVDGEVNKIDAIDAIRPGSTTASSISEARAAYESLSEDQKQIFPQEKLQDLVNIETAYVTVEKIAALGTIKYDVRSQESIQEARAAYDALSEEQKSLVAEEDLAALTAAEAAYAKKDASAKATYISLLIIVSLLTALSGMVLAYYIVRIRKAKGGARKAYSVVALPILLAASHYADSPFVALYVLTGLLLLILAADIVLAIKYPRYLKDLKKTVSDAAKRLFGKGAAEAPVEAPVAEEVPATDNSYYLITEESGKCTFALYYEGGDKLSKEMGVFDGEEAAKRAIELCRTKGADKQYENRVRESADGLSAPKFVLDVTAQGVYYYTLLDEDGTVLLQSVQYLNEGRCLEDLKKTLVCVTTDRILDQNGEVKSDVIVAVEDAIVAEESAAEDSPLAEASSEESLPSVETDVAATAEEDAEDLTEEEAEAHADDTVSLKENIAIAKSTTSGSKVNKKYVAEYLSDKYGDDVALRRRGDETKTGLPLADTHYAVTEEKNVCFVYVYEIGETTMLLVRVDEEYGKALAEKHPIVKRSAFPKSAQPWYSVIVDDSFSEEEIERVLDAAYIHCGGRAKAEAVSLKESLAAAKATATKVDRSKKGIADYLRETFAEAVELNMRVDRTKTGLPLADTHFAVKGDQRACFVYVYEVGAVMLLARLPEDYAAKLAASHATVKRSAFPKSKNAWYSVILDDSFSDEEVNEILDTAHACVLG